MSPVANAISFRAEGAYQRVCAYCQKAGAFQVHHVVDKSTLKGKGLRGDALYDTRNALRLCAPLTKGNCHMQFENGRIEITLAMLTDENIEYAFEILGIAAYEYLRREYGEQDARVELKLHELEAAA